MQYRFKNGESDHVTGTGKTIPVDRFDVEQIIFSRTDHRKVSSAFTGIYDNIIAVFAYLYIILIDISQEGSITFRDGQDLPGEYFVFVFMLCKISEDHMQQLLRMAYICIVINIRHQQYKTDLAFCLAVFDKFLFKERFNDHFQDAVICFVLYLTQVYINIITFFVDIKVQAAEHIYILMSDLQVRQLVESFLRKGYKTAVFAGAIDQHFQVIGHILDKELFVDILIFSRQVFFQEKD
ncbi:hypothetical protein D3C86_1205530 [compost metagenome]